MPVTRRPKVHVPQPAIKLPPRGTTGPVHISKLLNPVLEICRHPDRDRLLAESDVIALHCPLFPDTEGIINKETIAKMKDGAFFINTSRGGTVDENALYDALSCGKLSGAAVDVLKKEPMSKDCPLDKAPNIIITPHTSWAPLTTRKRLLGIVESNIEAFLKGAPRTCRSLKNCSTDQVENT